jgi:hypothetical protein
MKDDEASALTNELTVAASMHVMLPQLFFPAGSVASRHAYLVVHPVRNVV